MSQTFVAAVTVRAADAGQASNRMKGHDLPVNAAAGATPTSVAFLDVDGVLHSILGDNDDDMFEHACMARLHRVVTAPPGAAIVVSSSWREKEYTMRMLNDQLVRAGMDPAISSTPVCGFHARADEILHWLHNTPSVKHFVMLDDMDLTYPGADAFNRHIVRANGETGLTDTDVANALRVLQLKVDRDALPAARRPPDGYWS